MNEKQLQTSARQRVIYYPILLLSLTLGAAFLASRMKGSPVASLVMMWTPALAAILASLATRRSFKEMGWSLRPVKWLAAGWIIPILYGFAAYVPVWLTGLGDVPNPTFLERARLTLNMTEGSDLFVIVAAFAFITVVNLLPSMIFALGEEIGWRGFLVPELSRWMSLRSASLLSGVIWSAWHLPGILSGDYGAAGTPLSFQVASFALMVISGSVLFTWLRMRSGSIWPAVIMHAVHNNVIQSFFDRITADTGSTHYFTGEFGLMLPLVTLLFSMYIWRQLGSMERSNRGILDIGSLAGI
jgi:uncharacterized protein